MITDKLNSGVFIWDFTSSLPRLTTSPDIAMVRPGTGRGLA